MLRRACPGKLTVGEFARPLNMSLAAVSKHLKLLEIAGLVHRTVDQPQSGRHADLGHAHNREEAFGGASLCVELRGCQITRPALVLRNLAVAEAASGARQ